MNQNSRKASSPRALGFLVVTLAGVSLIAPACGSDRGALDPPSGGSGAKAGGGSTSLGGANRGGTSNGGRGGSGGAAGSALGGSAGMAGSSAGSDAGGADNGGQGGVATGGAPEPPEAVCIFHSPPIVDASAGAPGSGGVSGEGEAGAGGQVGAGGAGGAAGSGGAPPVYDITVQKNAFVGNYLADSAGKALYVFTADQAGDCENAPLTTCDIGCRRAWPPFNGGERALVEGLSDELFGTIELEDGTHQTTYFGWPLYYYRNDDEPGEVVGQGVGRVWHLAEVNLPNIVLLRIGMQRLLGDGTGRSLYVFQDDSVGTATANPVSACTGTCRSDFPPFTVSSLAPVSYLEPRDFSIFVRSDGGTQVAYKGAPLYWSRADARSGETNGATEAGWTVAAP